MGSICCFDNAGDHDNIVLRSGERLECDSQSQRRRSPAYAETRYCNRSLGDSSSNLVLCGVLVRFQQARRPTPRTTRIVQNCARSIQSDMGISSVHARRVDDGTCTSRREFTSRKLSLRRSLLCRQKPRPLVERSLVCN